jgi:hypothetical protein
MRTQAGDVSALIPPLSAHYLYGAIAAAISIEMNPRSGTETF